LHRLLNTSDLRNARATRSDWHGWRCAWRLWWNDLGHHLIYGGSRPFLICLHKLEPLSHQVLGETRVLGQLIYRDGIEHVERGRDPYAFLQHILRSDQLTLHEIIQHDELYRPLHRDNRFELMMDLMSHDGMSWFNPEGTVPAREESVASEHNYLRAATIYAGSNEIQKNIIAKMILGLPS